MRFLPIAVPVQCFTDPPGLSLWNQLRMEQGLMTAGKPSTGPLATPTSAAGGGWSQSPLNATPVGEWLRNLLHSTEAVGDGRVAMHIFKTTLLAWCACAGVSHGARKLLRHHISSSF